MTSYKQHFSRFLGAQPDRLHVAAHSHHAWPDVTFAAQQTAWDDAARLQDDKWEHIFAAVLPQMQRHIARRLGLADPAAIAVAPNTHELVVRVMSCLPNPARVVTTDAEFHSFSRQIARWEESGRVVVERIPSRPYATLVDRLLEAVERGEPDLLYVSHVLFDSGYVIENLDELVAAVPPATFTIIDAYHGFMALPTDFSASSGRAFYLAGGYKYAMAGEGACFLVCPPGYGPRPVNTGWYAGFGELVSGPGTRGVAYPADGGRFLGATFDPTALYRFNAVQAWLDDIGVSVEDIHRQVAALQSAFLDLVAGIVEPPDASPRGHFLSLRVADAPAVFARLHERGVLTDVRGDRLRIGFGLYHDDEDLPRLAEALTGAL